ncbi:S locus F-box protein with the low allelic sequence polymorphism 2-S4 [Prunus yedoensis var. nudiflora]|uniref:S locus F-box protein with the low allelic sequence polymorphism 2-S4 n=1 Tax=Prunus yedoensis var. nudiflora TaxID=2094558 RepID=A0A314XTD3_PRUYE|nr:S locus F-box protein with the low allelic sequence polymorphism 2-S4 [Prunus yedoensis var. nudiflora]
MATLSKFSEDMMGNILSRLPPKSLMRFRCVLKSWHDLIDKPSFVDQHLSTSTDNKVTSSTYVLLKHNVLTDPSIKDDEKAVRATLFNPDSDQRDILLSSINLGSLADDSLEIENHVVPPPMRGYALSLEIAGSCDGLICLNTFNSEDIVLCNPALEEYRVLPQVLHSFASASSTSNYKVVRAAQFVSGVFTQHPSKVEVYSLAADTWREIPVDIQPHGSLNPSYQMYFKGFFYWIAYWTEERNVILSFDMSEEVFHDIALPESGPDAYEYTSIAVWKDSLVLLTYPVENEAPKTIDLWVLDEDLKGAKGLWKKHLAIGPLEKGVEAPLVFWKDEELLMVMTNGDVVNYSLETQKLKHVPRHGLEEPTNIQAVPYVNSIVSIKPGNKIESI